MSPTQPAGTDRLVGAAVSVRDCPIEKLLPAYRDIGYTKFETMFGWPAACYDLEKGVDAYRDLGREHGIRYSSAHLGRVTADDLDASVAAALEQAAFAEKLGCSVVIFKADARETYARAARPFLDQLEARGIRLTPVITNHKGSPISGLDDYRAVIDAIGDRRMKTLLEVGHFARDGVHWRDGYDLLGDSVALVHINEISDEGASVRYGTGAVDFVGLFKALGERGYGGDIVVELEVAGASVDEAIDGMAGAFEYLKTNCVEHLR